MEFDRSRTDGGKSARKDAYQGRFQRKGSTVLNTDVVKRCKRTVRTKLQDLASQAIEQFVEQGCVFRRSRSLIPAEADHL